MRLYLSSYRWGDRFDELLAAVGPGARTAVVSNALDLIPEASRETYARTVFDPVGVLRGRGLDAFDLDLRAWFGRPAELEAALAEVRLLWAVGGNAFLLMRAIRQSGLEPILKRRLAAGDLVYGGWSAGAVVAGVSLRGLELMDEPDRVAPGYDPPPVWDGMGLIDDAVVPHFDSDHPEAEAAGRTHAYMSAQGLAHRTLRDGEVIVVD